MVASSKAKRLPRTAGRRDALDFWSEVARHRALHRTSTLRIPPTAVGGCFRSFLQQRSAVVLKSHQRQLLDGSSPHYLCFTRTRTDFRARTINSLDLNEPPTVEAVSKIQRWRSDEPEPGAERLHARERYVIPKNNPRNCSLACSRSAPGSGFLVATLLVLTKPQPLVGFKSWCKSVTYHQICVFCEYRFFSDKNSQHFSSESFELSKPQAHLIQHD